MERCSHFWVGLGIGSILGMLGCRYASSAKGKELKLKMDVALHKVGGEAQQLLHSAKEKALNVGTKMADKVAEKADEMKVKVHTMGDGLK